MTKEKSHHPPRPRGHLVIIGGKEDRGEDKKILRRFVELAGGEQARILVVTAASAHHDEMWDIYDEAFADLGVQQRRPLSIHSREDANDAEAVTAVHEATGIFMTGGDQRRLLALIGGTKIDDAMHRAYKEHGACIGGTSAGASAMSEHMLLYGDAEPLPGKGIAALGAGLGFLQRAIVDQHFSERQRLGRLMSLVAMNPYLLGIGIDENTAIVITPFVGFEVIGDGAVTLIDGRGMSSNFLEAKERELLELINVTLHLLPAGARYSDGSDAPRGPGADRRRPTPSALMDLLPLITGKDTTS